MKTFKSRKNTKEFASSIEKKKKATFVHPPSSTIACLTQKMTVKTANGGMFRISKPKTSNACSAKTPGSAQRIGESRGTAKNPGITSLTTRGEFLKKWSNIQKKQPPKTPISESESKEKKGLQAPSEDEDKLACSMGEIEDCSRMEEDGLMLACNPSDFDSWSQSESYMVKKKAPGTSSMANNILNGDHEMIIEGENEDEAEMGGDEEEMAPAKEGEGQSPLKKKRRKKRHYLCMIRAKNGLEEMNKFFEMGCKYNPQFIFQEDIIHFPKQLLKPQNKYFQLAQKILDTINSKFGSDAEFFKQEKGEIISKEETEKAFDEYIEAEGLNGLIGYEFSENMVSPTTFFAGKTKCRVMVGLPIMYRTKTIKGVINHEIGVHFMRYDNEKKQVWSKRRSNFKLSSCLSTEEGLASLAQMYEMAVDPNSHPFLQDAALYYYACCQGKKMSFEELYADLEKYISDPVRRYKQCSRVKRGPFRSDEYKSMSKDQAYLKGAIELLVNRKKIDFLTLFSGKLNLGDHKKLQRMNLIRKDVIHLPYFMRDINKFHIALDRIAATNFIDTLC